MTNVITVDQPYASLIMAGVKRWETRGNPPNGDMRPDGVRGLPGLKVDAGERIGVAASLRKRDVTEIGWEPWLPLLDPEDSGRLAEPMSFGAILGTVEVTRVMPVVSEWSDLPAGWDESSPFIVAVKSAGSLAVWNPESAVPQGFVTVDISDQLPYGHWLPGNWGWELADPIPTTEQCPDGCTRFHGRMPGHVYGSNWDWVPCQTCGGAMTCPPIPVKGKQGVWEWTA